MDIHQQNQQSATSRSGDRRRRDAEESERGNTPLLLFNQICNVVEAMTHGADNTQSAFAAFVATVQKWGVVYRQMEQNYDVMQRELNRTQRNFEEMTQKEEKQRKIASQLRSELDSAQTEIEFLQKKIKIIQEQLYSGSSLDSDLMNDENVDVVKVVKQVTRKVNGTKSAATAVSSHTTLKPTNRMNNVNEPRIVSNKRIVRFENEGMAQSSTTSSDSLSEAYFNDNNNVALQQEFPHSKRTKPIANQNNNNCFTENQQQYIDIEKTMPSKSAPPLPMPMSTPNVDNKRFYSVPDSNFKSPVVCKSHLDSPNNRISVHSSGGKLTKFSANKKSVVDSCSSSKPYVYSGASKYFPTTHHFKSQVSTSLRGVCTSCGQKIGFRKQIKLCLTCRATCHTECFSSLPKPCFHSSAPKTPLKLKSSSKGFSLEMLCQKHSPYVPGLLVHLIIEIEKRGLDFVGLYTMNGPQKTVRNLMERFHCDQIIPNFSIITDIGVLSDCVKEFFNYLNDTIIPANIWPKMCRAAVKEDSSEMVKCIRQMKKPNRDTLSLIILHFQKVCRNSANNKTSPTILARVFADMLARYNHQESENGVEYYNKKENQIKMIESLIALPQCSLVQNIENDSTKMLNEMI